jgi:pheromone shutdown protein TraB
MSAALSAARGETVGVDGIDAGFLRRLATTLRAEDASSTTVRRTARSVAGIGRRAVACRFAAVTGREGPGPNGGSANYDCTAADDPATQAADEQRHRSRSRSLLAAVERPHADRVLDSTREAAMARRLVSLRREGSVVAVVGFDHLEAVADPPRDGADRLRDGADRLRDGAE